MADNLTILGKEVIIGGSEHLRDSDIEERLCEGEMFIGDSLQKGTAETQVVAHPGTSGANAGFKGICLGHSIRQSPLEDFGSGDRTDAVALLIKTGGGLLTPGKMIKYLKRSGGRYKVRIMVHGQSGSLTVPSGSPVFHYSTGSTIGSTLSGLGNFFVDDACTDDGAIVGYLSKECVIPDATTNDVNIEAEMWY